MAATAGCGTPHISTTTIPRSAGPTPTVIEARTAIRTVNAAPPIRGLPLQTRTHSGRPGDPINIAFEGSRSAIVTAFQKIGWVQADPLSIRNDTRLARDAIEHKLYPAAPVSKLYVLGRPEDLAVERELNSVARRDHARFWDTHRRDPVTHQEFWIGDAARDAAIEVVFKHHLPAGTTHRIAPDIDAERGRIVTAMRSAGALQVVVMEPGIGKTKDGRNGENNTYYTDGKVAVVVLATP